MVLRNGPNITHGAKNFRDVPGNRREPDFPLGKLISSASNSGGSNVPHMLWGGLAYAGKGDQPNGCSTCNEEFTVHFRARDGCHRLAVRNSSLTLTSKFLFINTRVFPNRHSH